MQKPKVDLEGLSIGKIFQIDPASEHPLSVQYGGDFLISTKYSEAKVMGYLACVNDPTGIVRHNGVAYLIVPWEILECVGQAEWFKKDRKDVEISDV